MRILVVHTETEDILINHLNLDNDEVQRAINEFYEGRLNTLNLSERLHILRH